jgi:hypothetical protein
MVILRRMPWILDSSWTSLGGSLQPSAAAMTRSMDTPGRGWGPDAGRQGQLGGLAREWRAAEAEGGRRTGGGAGGDSFVSMSEDMRSMGEAGGVAAALHESNSCCARSSREQRLSVEGSGAAEGPSSP